MDEVEVLTALRRPQGPSRCRSWSFQLRRSRPDREGPEFDSARSTIWSRAGPPPRECGAALLGGWRRLPAARPWLGGSYPCPHDEIHGMNLQEVRSW